MIRTSIVLLAAVAALQAAAQSAPPLAGIDRPTDWTIDEGAAKAKPSRRKASVKTQPALSPEETERAARLDESRRKFFAAKPDPKPSDEVKDFGGYDGGTMGDGALKPGYGLKF